MPFGSDCEYTDMDACIAANRDKNDPAAYCGALMRDTEDGCASRSVRMFTTKVYRPEEIKVIDEATGRISAVVSSEKIDRDGDVIRASGWEMKNFLRHPVLLASHDYHSLRSQIGTWESMEVVNGKMQGVARFFIGRGNEEADWAFELAKEKSLAFSVGFIPNMEKAAPLYDDDSFGTRGMEFKGQELLEVSAVTIPSNPDALQRFVKAPNLHPAIVEIAEERLAAEIEALPFSDLAEEPESFDHIDMTKLTWRTLEDVIIRVIENLKERDANSEEADAPQPPEEEPTADDDTADADDYGDGDEPESRITSDGQPKFNPYAVAEAAAMAALEEVLDDA